jgi:small subunit ribosomal protein S2
MSNVEIEKLFENAVHVGHRKHKWNPRMKKYIYTERNGIHIIDLEKTLVCLNAALDFVSKTAAEGKTILFVSTKPQSIKLLEGIAKSCSMPYVVGKWIPGFLTNFATIKSRIKYLANLKEQKESGEFEKFTKKEAVKLGKEIDRLQIALGGVQNVTKKPDCVFVVDVVRDAIVVKEAIKLSIPVVGITDTNADPSVIDYPIPANDDALKALSYLLEKFADAVNTGKKAKK